MRSVLYSSTIFLVGACVVAASETRVFDRTLAVSGPVRLEVRSNPGGITISVGNDSSVRVHATIRPLYGRFDLGLAEANIRALEQNPPIEQTGNRLRIGYVNLEALRGVSMQLDIQVPRSTQARAQTSSGGIRIDGIVGPAVAETSSGQTDISNIAGDVSVTGHSGAILVRGAGGHVFARNESGGIQVLNARGPVELRTNSGRTEASGISAEIRSTTHSGSISIDHVDGPVIATNSSGKIDAFQLSGPIQAETKSGAIRLSQIRPAPIRARAQSGSITVDLASQRGYRIDAQSESGKVAGPVMEGKERVTETHRWQGQIGAGGPLVDLDTNSSKIQIR